MSLSTKLLAGIAATALSAGAAQAHDVTGTHYSHGTTYGTSTYGTTTYATTPSYGTTTYATTPSYGTTTYGSSVYAAPTIDLGPIETVPSTTYSTTTVVPATTSTYSVQPSYGTTTYGETVYQSPTYSTQPVYSTPTYTTPTYGAPVYGTPSYGIPSYGYAPAYDATDRVRSRIKRQRSRIERALDRGDLRSGELKRLRRNLRDIRRTFRAYRDNDGVIGQWEERALMDQLDRNSQRIRRLANNGRVVGGGAYSPYGYPVHRY